MQKKILNVVSALFGLLLINGGLDKFFHYMPMPETMPEETVKDMTALMEIEWLMPLIATAELVGGVLLLFPKTRALGAIVVLPVMVGVLLTHVLVDRSGLIIALVIWAILLWIIYDSWKKYLPMIKS
jgi:putative oxidoreductase